MKRQIFTLASMLLVVAMVFALASCDAVKGLLGGADEHQHTYSADWSSDATNHWHAATCTDTDECKSAKADEAAHTFGADNKCTACGYEKTVAPAPHTHTYATTLTAGETTHWYAATCNAEAGCATAKKEEAAHAYTDGKCVCGADEPGTLANPLPITIPGTLKVSVGAKEVVYYTLTIAEAKTLEVTIDSVNASIACATSIEELEFFAVEGYLMTDLEAGTYYIAFTTADEAAGEYNVTAGYYVAPALGTEENPIFPMFDDNGTAKVTVPAGATHHFATNNLSEDATLTANGVKIDFVYGNPMFRAPSTFTITNNTDADVEYTLVITYSVGSSSNPEVIDDITAYNPRGNALSHTFAEGDDAYYYQWTATEDGLFTLAHLWTVDAENNVIGWQYNVYQIARADGTYYYGELRDSTGEITSDTIEVFKGDVVYFFIGTYDAENMFTLPAGTVNMYPSFAAVGSMMNPEVLNDPSSVAVKVEAGNNQGYYYTWTSAYAGTLTLTCPTIEDVEYDVILSISNDDVTVQKTLLEDGADGKVSIDVNVGDVLNIQVIAVPDAEWNYPAVEVTIAAGFVPAA